MEPTQEDVNTLAEWLHQKAGIREGYHRKWSELSVSQKARSLHLARLLLSEPPLVLMSKGREIILLCRNALNEIAEWSGGFHDDDCPADDTCDCGGQYANAALNNAFLAADKYLKE